ncbi:phosphoribosylamine--glycine ligase [Salinarimonas sp. NSM]|uniref:phosphoribosylamine--glycine ligase n=1 Tax=Salinarimonas sp. NSM TaxID=3458003 RepID=UPI004036C016
MNVLLIGSGGREHALAWKLVQSPLCDALFCAPGNAGTAEVATNVALDVADHAAVIAFCRARAVGLVVVGNEAPLVAGLVDDLAAAGIAAFGPTREAARLEGSKAFTKAICDETGAPTAAYARFDAAEPALAWVRDRGAPIVVKYDGLAAGKGVVVAETVAQAEEAVRAMLAGPGDALVIEDFLEGEEVSLFALCDGTTALPLASAQDHKRAFDGDVGPNTGGMGAYSPAPVLTPELQARAMAEIVEPTLAALRARGTPFVGVLYAGLMIGADGPKLVEYNVRFGDPEAQALMPRLEGDLLAAMLAACAGRLAEVSLGWRDEAALVVTLAARGYPGAVESGSEIRGLDAAAALPGVRVFHAGTKRDGDRVLASGGRVLSVVGLGADVAHARARAYAGVDAIDWPQGFCRRDIGWRALAR